MSRTSADRRRRPLVTGLEDAEILLKVQDTIGTARAVTAFAVIVDPETGINGVQTRILARIFGDSRNWSVPQATVTGSETFGEAMARKFGVGTGSHEFLGCVASNKTVSVSMRREGYTDGRLVVPVVLRPDPRQAAALINDENLSLRPVLLANAIGSIKREHHSDVYSYIGANALNVFRHKIHFGSIW